MSKRKKIASLAKQLSGMKHKLDKLSKKHAALADALARLTAEKPAASKPAKAKPKKAAKPAAKPAPAKRAKKPMKPTLVKPEPAHADKAAS